MSNHSDIVSLDVIAWLASKLSSREQNIFSSERHDVFDVDVISWQSTLLCKISCFCFGSCIPAELGLTFTFSKCRISTPISSNANIMLILRRGACLSLSGLFCFFFKHLYNVMLDIPLHVWPI